MAWTAGADVTTGDLITAAQWNSYLGAAGSLDYLKAEADKHNDCSYSDVTGSRALDTIYQNGSKLRLVCITIQNDSGEVPAVWIGSSSPPTNEVCSSVNATGFGHIGHVHTFLVPANWYYECESAFGAPQMMSWIEWDLL